MQHDIVAIAAVIANDVIDAVDLEDRLRKHAVYSVHCAIVVDDDELSAWCRRKSGIADDIQIRPTQFDGAGDDDLIELSPRCWPVEFDLKRIHIGKRERPVNE